MVPQAVGSTSLSEDDELAAQVQIHAVWPAAAVCRLTSVCTMVAHSSGLACAAWRARPGDEADPARRRYIACAPASALECCILTHSPVPHTCTMMWVPAVLIHREIEMMHMADLIR